MKRFFYLLLFSVYGSLFYCALKENFSLINITIGFITGCFGAYINRRGFINPSFFAFFKYFLLFINLAVNIYVSAVKVIIGFFKKQSFEIKTVKADENISAVTQANFITLTPGTVTVERHDNTLSVLQFCNEKHKEQ